MSGYGITYFSARRLESIDILTAIPCFRGQTTGIDYWEYNPLSGHVVKRRRRPFSWSDNAKITDEQLNSANIGIVVEMLLQTRIRAELWLICHVRPVNVRQAQT